MEWKLFHVPHLNDGINNLAYTPNLYVDIHFWNVWNKKAKHVGISFMMNFENYHFFADVKKKIIFL